VYGPIHLYVSDSTFSGLFVLSLSKIAWVEISSSYVAVVLNLGAVHFLISVKAGSESTLELIT
jgi:hypothetical protein